MEVGVVLIALDDMSVLSDSEAKEYERGVRRPAARERVKSLPPPHPRKSRPCDIRFVGRPGTDQFLGVATTGKRTHTK